MRSIDKLKLTKLSKVELEAREMNLLRGGTDADPTCNCNCSSAGTRADTQSANAKYDYQYSYGGDGSNMGTTFCGCYNSDRTMQSVRG